MKLFFKITTFILVSVIITLFGILSFLYIKTYNLNLQKSKLLTSSTKIEFYDSKNEVFATEFKQNNCDYIELNKLNDYTINAFIAIEDRRFYTHKGLDYKRILSATLKNVISLSFKEGASTISQQLVKNTHLSSEKTLTRKFAEIKITKQLEKNYSKEEILEMYLNSIYFGKGAYGINSASKLYFNKPADSLTINESCILAGIIKSPSKYSPIDNANNCFTRKNTVLKAMLNCNFITITQYNKLIKEEIEISVNSTKKAYGDYLKGVKNQFETIIENNPYNKNSTIKIYTYLNTTLQNEIEKIKLEKSEKTNESKIVINSKNNGVIAFCGDNSILKRNPASCVKPWLVYAPMINDKFITESTIIEDKKINFGDYSPKNFGDKYYGNVTIKTALSKSLNIPAVKLLNSYGVNNANKYTSKMGVDIKNQSLACALGSINKEMSLQEVCDCYSPFTNNGFYNPSSFIKEVIIGKDCIYKNIDKNIKVFSAETAYIINNILKDSIKTGTSKKLNEFEFDISAKTGTNGITNGNIDAYSISYTTEHIVGVWLGNYNSKLMSNNISGGTYPCIYNREIIKLLYKNHTPKQFERPDDIVKCNIDKDLLYKEQKTILNDDGETFYYIKGTEPNLISNNSKVSLNDFSIKINNNIVVINNSILNNSFIKNIKIKRTKNKKTIVVYDGEITNEIIDNLKDFGEYQYSIEILNEDNKINIISLPKINYSKKNNKFINSDWWNN